MEKINVAELLKDCPMGMELDCTIYDNATFCCILEDNRYPIKIQTPEGHMLLSKYGCMSLSAHTKCVIFPKGKTTWEGFHRPFDDGDIVATEHGLFIGIVKVKNNVQVNAYCSIDDSGCFGINSTYGFERLATEEEKQKLFKAIKEHGYKWNAETKTLEKLIEPKFKVGDRVRHKTTNKNDVYEISKVYDDSYGLVNFTWMIYMKYQDQYELVSNKFDINTLVPFESKVLVRDDDVEIWIPAIWGIYDDEYGISYPYLTIGGNFAQCIPYEGNEHLLGTRNKCDDYYKTWE